MGAAATEPKPSSGIPAMHYKPRPLLRRGWRGLSVAIWAIGSSVQASAFCLRRYALRVIQIGLHYTWYMRPVKAHRRKPA